MIRVFSTKRLNNPFLNTPNVDFQSTDFIKIDFLEGFQIPSQGSLIITSQNAVRSLERNGLLDTVVNRNIYCVGEQTAQMLKSKGFVNILLIASSAAELAEQIQNNHDPKEPLIYMCGNLYRPELPEKLMHHGFLLEKRIVYRTTLTPIKLSYTPDVVLFFSPSGVQSYLLKNELGASQCFCIGQTTCDELKPHTNQLVVSKESSGDSLIQTVCQGLPFLKK